MMTGLQRCKAFESALALTLEESKLSFSVNVKQKKELKSFVSKNDICCFANIALIGRSAVQL